MPTSTAHVTTATPARYAKQLVSHLGHKVPAEDIGDGHRLLFPFGQGVVRISGDDLLVLEATAPDADSLARVEDVLGRHLERFGQRHELTVTWHVAPPAG